MVVLCWAATAYMVVLTARIVLSWFPVRPGTPMASVYAVLYDLTEPVLGPLRRVIPPAGMFDLSPLVVFFGLIIVRGILCG